MTIPTVQVDRRLAGEPVTLTLQPVDSSDQAYVLTDPAAYSIRDGAGALVTSGDATVAEGGASLSFTLAAGALTELDTYAVQWSALVGTEALAWSSRLEVCGGHLVGIAALRSSLAEMANVDLAKLLLSRLVAEQLFEGECQVAFVPRGARATVRGTGRDTLVLPHVAVREVLSLAERATPAAAPVALTEAQIAAIDVGESGVLTLLDDVWTKGARYEVRYAHGYDAPTADVVDAVRMLAVEIAKPSSGADPRAMSLTNDVGTFRLATAGRDGATGLPFVDASIERRKRDLPAVG